MKIKTYRIIELNSFEKGPFLKYTTRELSTIIVFTSIGALFSVPIGYLGNYLKTIPILPMGTGQVLAGFHLIMIGLAAERIRKQGTGTITGLLKGLVEAVLFSYHGVVVIAMSAVQGLVIDVFIMMFGDESRLGLVLGCGVSALSNVLFMHFIIRLPFPPSVFFLMYLLSFISGIVFGAYPVFYLQGMIAKRI